MLRSKHKYTWGTFVIQILMSIAGLLFIIPVLMVVSYSFKTKLELYIGNPLSLPQHPSWANYVMAFQKLNMGTTFFNTVLYTGVSVVIVALISGAASWAIARNSGKFFKFSYIYFIVGILIPYQALFLPIYIMGYTLHLTNTYYGIILMYVATGMSFGVFLMTSFMNTVPIEIEEASRIDGCSIYRTYFNIVLPLIKPAMATLIIMQSFVTWNDYLMASLFASDNNLQTITVNLQMLFSQEQNDYTTAMAAIVISFVPVCILFISLQKYFIKGMTVGAVKG
jgi:raffinose/stachyose/melibiose transport system permease protein